MAGGAGQPEQPQEQESETRKYLSVLSDDQNIFQGYGKSSGTKYVPRAVLVRHFAIAGRSLDTLLRENLEEEEHIPQAETVLQQYLVVFTILLSIGKGKYLNRCIERDYNDEKLPFFDRPRHFPKSEDGSFFDAFFDAQWKFCPIKFTKNPVNLQIEPEQIFPLRRREESTRNVSSTTYLVELHEDYDLLGEDNPILDIDLGISKPASHNYLFKEFKKTFKSTYDKELTAFLYLQKSGQLLGKSVTGFYGSFIQDETYTIILEHADYSTLDAFMSHVPPPTNGEDITRVWESILKLHEGLHTIHNLNAPYSAEVKQHTLLRGWHRSLSPQNIFVVKSETGSDYDCSFRIATIGTLDEIENARSYTAPECLVPQPETNMQMGDVFSLGCILSEFAVWISCGLSGLNDYRSDRKHETADHGTRDGLSTFHDGQALLQTVAHWNNAAIENRADQDKITEPLMQQVIEEMLCEDGDVRPTTRQLKAKITKIISRAREQYLADLRRHDSAASNSTGYSSAGLSSRSHLSYRNSVRSDSTGETAPANGGPLRGYLGRSGTARSNVISWASPSAIDESKEVCFGPTNTSQPVSPVSSIDRSRVPQIPKTDSEVDGRDAPEPLRQHTTSRVATLSGPTMAALLNGDDKEIVVSRGLPPTTLRPFVPSEPELRSGEVARDPQAAQVIPPPRTPQRALGSSDPPPDRLSTNMEALSNGALTDTPIEIRPDHDPRGADSSSASAFAILNLSRSQITASVFSSQTQMNTQSDNDFRRTLSSHGGTTSNQAQEAPKPLVYKPILDLIDGLLWLNSKKGSASGSTLRDESYLSQVGDRDFVFLIDDSGSMRAHREMTSRCVRLMAWLLKKHDRNGMDLYFMSKSGKTHTRPGHSSDLQRPLLKTLDECKGVNNVNTRMAQILAEYRGRSATGSGSQTGGRSSFASIGSTRTITGAKKLMVYIISDGKWETGSENQLVNTMDAVATALSVQGAPDKAIGIQFIRSTEENKGRFDILVAGRRDMEAKIVVDTVDLESNVFRSLLGPVVDLWDDE